MSDDALSRLLTRVPCFNALPNDAVALLRSKMTPNELAAGELLCREGDRGDRLYIIESGSVAVLKSRPNGDPAELTTLGPGDVAGELSLFTTGTRTATLQARQSTRVWTLQHETFQRLLSGNPGLATFMLNVLSKHLCRESSVVAKLISRELDHRLKVVFFDSKPDTEAVFKARNEPGYALKFHQSRLCLETVALAAGHDVVCVFVNDDLNAAVVEELHALGVRMVALRCAGYNNVDITACEQLGLPVVRVPAYSPHAVAEHAVALMLTLNRRVNRAYNRVRDGNFTLHGLLGFDMHGKTAGVVGAGQIGRCLLDILHGFGCRLLAYDTRPAPELEQRLGVTFCGLPQLFSESDIISLHVPLLPETRYMINAAALAQMKRGVMLINTSRGALVDTAALVEGLKSGHIGYAGLDVYEEESGYFFEDRSDQVLTDDVLARLTTFNNVVITGHQAFFTREALENIADTTLGSIRELEQGGGPGALSNRIRSRA